MRLCSAEPGASPHTGAGPCRIVVIGDTLISEQGMATLVARDKPRRNIFRKNATPMAMCVIKPHQILAQTTTGEAHMVSFCASPWDLRLIRREEKLWAPNNQRQP